MKPDRLRITNGTLFYTSNNTPANTNTVPNTLLTNLSLSFNHQYPSVTVNTRLVCWIGEITAAFPPILYAVNIVIADVAYIRAQISKLRNTFICPKYLIRFTDLGL